MVLKFKKLRITQNITHMTMPSFIPGFKIKLNACELKKVLLVKKRTVDQISPKAVFRRLTGNIFYINGDYDVGDGDNHMHHMRELAVVRRPFSSGGREAVLLGRRTRRERPERGDLGPRI